MIQCANDSHRLLDLRFIDPFKTEYKLMNDVPDLDTPMYSKSKFYEMFVLLRKRSYLVDFLTSPTIGNPVTPIREIFAMPLTPCASNPVKQFQFDWDSWRSNLLGY